ncbi:MAG: DNA-3-methyladenine glycosylase [Acidimicrobiales bacterium]
MRAVDQGSGGGLVGGLRPFARGDFARDALEVAPELLNRLIVVGERVGRIVEVEAYRGPDDPASHAYRGKTPRNATMWGAPGHLYVYFTYGMHWCANVVCAEPGVAHAVLIRALVPIAGLDEMRTARPSARRDRDLMNGPAKTCAALGVTGAHDGADLIAGDRGVRLVADGVVPPARPARGPRIGISAARELPWRWWVPGDPHVSRPAKSQGCIYQDPC